MLPLKKWKILNTDINKPVVDMILHNRNLSLDHLRRFRLSERLHDPFLLKDLDKAIQRIKNAINHKEKILIFGDYDTDGISSTVLMVKFFEKIKYSVDYYIPSRQKDGYGLKPAGVDHARAQNTDLLITVDNGISSGEAVLLANSHGIDVIITDHHLQEGVLPEAYAIVNPNRDGCEYPFKGLCGAGVAYKLIQALAIDYLSEEEYKNFMLAQLDLVALATVADIVPLQDENYALVKYGLQSLKKTGRPGIIELKRVSGLLGKDITTTAIAFYLSPRLNAAGRLGDAELAVRLLLSSSREEARQLASQLNGLNSQRQKLQEKYIDEALYAAQGSEDNIHILINEEWDAGIIGIVSGKLKDMLGRPVVVFTTDGDGNYVGSARSTDNFHITHALSRYQDLYLSFGGHQKAAGLTISPDNFDRFKQNITEYVNQTLDTNELSSELIIDTVTGPEQLSAAVVETIESIGPFGEGNPEPVLLLCGVTIKEIMRIGQNSNHLKLIVQKGGSRFECVWWNRSDVKNDIEFDMTVDVAFRPEINLWNGYKKVQLVIEDIAPSPGYKLN